LIPVKHHVLVTHEILKRSQRNRKHKIYIMISVT
jgi:hypothetical protein